MFRSSSGLELIIISFSVVQRLHLFVMLLYGLARQTIVHLILKSLFLSPSCQIYLDSSVLFMNIQGMFVLRESLLECSFCQSNVVFRSIVVVGRCKLHLMLSSYCQ